MCSVYVYRSFFCQACKLAASPEASWTSSSAYHVASLDQKTTNKMDSQMKPSFFPPPTQDLLNFDDPLNIDAAEHHLRDKVNGSNA